MKPFKRSIGAGSSALALAVFLLSAGSAGASIADLLGPAGDFAILGLDGNNDHLSSGPFMADGNVGVGDNSTLQFDGGGTINGSVFSSASASVNDGGNHISGSANTVIDFSSINAGVANLQNFVSSQTATQTFGTINNALTLQSTAAVNVISVNGIDLSGGTLTLNGNASSEFVIRDTGNFHLSGGTMISLTGGLTANNVVWDITGGPMQTDGHSFTQGIFLSDNGIQINGGTHNSEFIAIGGAMSFQSNPQVYQIPNTTPVPEANAGLVLAALFPLILLITPARLRKVIAAFWEGGVGAAA